MKSPETIPAEFHVDHEAGVGYIKLPFKGQLIRTIKLTEDVLLDVSDEGEICGVEFLKLDWR